MTTPRSSAEYYQRQQRLLALLLAALRRVWRRMDPAAPRWEEQYQDDGVGAQLLMLVAAAQVAAARDADAYIAAVLAELGIVPDPAPGIVIPAAFAGVAGDGRPAESLLAYAVPRAGARFNQLQATTAAAASAVADLERPDWVSDAAWVSLVREHEDRVRFDLDHNAEQAAQQALADAGRWVETVAATMVIDAARAAESAATTVHPGVTGYVRMLNPPSCSRCAVLAGRFYRWNEGFERHPQCFPAGTVVSGPSGLGATRRWYEGELLTLRTASGKQLSVTANHPILTRRGWVPAHLLLEGEEIVTRAGGDRAEPLVAPDEHQMPARIEDVWSAGLVDSLSRVPVAAEDFHGDGVGSSHVDVVATDRLLRNRTEVSGLKDLGESAFSRGSVVAPLLPPPRVSGQLAFSPLASTGRILGGPGALGALLRGERTIQDVLSLARVANGHLGGNQARSDRAPTHSQPLADLELALARLIGRNDGRDIQRQVAPRWDAPTAPFSMKSRARYAEIGEDLRLRLADKVALDRLVEKRSVKWSGHVYNLTSREGWYDADGFIVSNCDCRHIPATEAIAGDLTVNPHAYFTSLNPADQDRIFTHAGARAIRDGADIGQVVNARRGMEKAQVYGRDVLLTREGITRRGQYGRARGGFEKQRGRRYQASTHVRLMPESIYEIAEDHADAIRLLKLHRFIT